MLQIDYVNQLLENFGGKSGGKFWGIWGDYNVYVSRDDGDIFVLADGEYVRTASPDEKDDILTDGVCLM